MELGLKSYREDPTSCMDVAYDGGLKLTTKEMLTNFGWTILTYQHKTQAYNNAFDLASHYSWKGHIPGILALNADRYDFI